MLAQLSRQMSDQSTAQRQQMDALSTAQRQHAEDLNRKLEEQATAQRQHAEALDRKLGEQSTDLKAHTAEAVRSLEERLAGQIQAESAKLHSSLRREVDAITERVDSVEKGQDLNRQHIQNQQERLESVTKDHQALQQEVRDKFSALSQRLDSTQRELYQRLSVAGSTGSVDDTGLTAQSLPLGNGSSRLRVRPVAYDGKTPWSAWHIQYEQICAANCFDEAEKTSFLVASLCGPALNVLANLPPGERSSYTSLVAALSTRFDDSRASEMARVKLDNRRRERNEPLSKFAGDLEDLFRVAYPTASSEVRELLLKERFLNGLDSQELKKQTKLMRPTTFH